MKARIAKNQALGAEPVSVELAKLHLRALPGNAEDELIGMMIAAARDYCEKLAGRSYVDRRVTAYADGLGDILLPYCPVREIEKITVYDENGTGHVLNANSYSTVYSDDGEITIDANAYSGSMRDRDPVEIVYTTGYDETPPTILQAMAFLIGHYYTNREAVVVGNAASIVVPLAVDRMIRCERVWWF